MIGSEPGFASCLAVALGPRAGAAADARRRRSERLLAPVARRPQPRARADRRSRRRSPGRDTGSPPPRRRTGDRDAVLMFGVPSGPLLDPAGLLARGGSLVEGVVIAPFQLGLDVVGAVRRAGGGGRSSSPGSWSLRRPRGRSVASRSPGGRGTRARGRPLLQRRRDVLGTGRGYELTLIEAEALEALAADGVEISWEEARRNVVTRGIGLNALVGRRFRIGEVECAGRRLAEPCSHLQRLAPPGILAGLVHRGGLRADILGSGTIRVGDPVVPIPDVAQAARTVVATQTGGRGERSRYPLRSKRSAAQPSSSTRSRCRQPGAAGMSPVR